MGLLYPRDEVSSSLVVISTILNMFALCVALCICGYFWRHTRINGCKCFSTPFARKKTVISLQSIEVTHKHSVSRSPNMNVATDAVNTVSSENEGSPSDIEMDSSIGSCLILMFCCYIVFCLWASFTSSTIVGWPATMFTDGYCQRKMIVEPSLFTAHKAMIYFVFSYRIQKTFAGSVLDFPLSYYRAYRIGVISCVVAIVISTYAYILPKYQSRPTSDGMATVCVTVDLSLANGFKDIWVVAVVQIVDSFFSITALVVYVTRLRKVMQLATDMNSYNIAKEYHSVIKKSTILVCIAVASTGIAMLLLITEFNLMVVTTVDMSVNSICVLFLFRLPLFQRCYKGMCGVVCANCCVLASNQSKIRTFSKSIEQKSSPK